MAGNRLIRPLQELQMASSFTGFKSVHTNINSKAGLNSWNWDQGVPANLHVFVE